MRLPASAVLVPLFAILLIVPAALSSQGTVITAPSWEIGDWWVIELRDARELRPVEARLVVSAIEAGDYLVGVEHGDSYLELLTYHFPFFGRVSSTDLSYEVHAHSFHPVRFPMQVGDTWDTRFSDLDLRAHVVSIQGDQARIEYVHGDMTHATAAYDATARTLTEWSLAEHGTLVVKEYGRGFSCDVDYAPRHELLFVDYAMGSTVMPIEVGEPKNIEVHRDLERAAIVMVAGGAEGLFSSVVMPPDGSTHSVSVYPHDADRWRLAVMETLHPMGTWRVDSIASNQGFALSEAMGFDLRTVDLGDKHALEFRTSDCVSPAKRVAPMVAFGGNAEQGWSGAVVVALALTGIVGAWFALRKAAAWLPPFVFLYAKIPKERVLESRVRSDMVELLKQQPGLTTQEMRRALEIGWGNTVHHLAILERSGMVVGTSWGHNRHWFLQAETPASGRMAISALRRDAARTVYDAIKRSPGLSQEDLAKDLSIHHSTVFFHVERLMRANLVHKNRDGSRVRYYPTDGQAAAPRV